MKVLRRLDVDVSFPEQQTCCGQIAFNGGYRAEATAVARRFLDIFAGDDYVVVPSGSCASMIKVFYAELFQGDEATLERVRQLVARTYEFTEFLTEVLEVDDVGAKFSGSVTYHDGCHALRELRIKQGPRALVAAVEGAELREMEASEACCGFGGLFSVKFPEVSGAILDEKLRHVEATGARAVVTTDCGCVMHMAGAMRRRALDTRALHIAELLAGEGG